LYIPNEVKDNSVITWPSWGQPKLPTAHVQCWVWKYLVEDWQNGSGGRAPLASVRPYFILQCCHKNKKQKQPESIYPGNWRATSQRASCLFHQFYSCKCELLTVML
jgi:hypothetical protein